MAKSYGFGGSLLPHYRCMPSEERFGLTSQICRAAASVPANIAEGFGRWNARDSARFIAVASGSLRELETHLLITQRLGFTQKQAVESALRNTDELAKMLYRMRSRVIANMNSREMKKSGITDRTNF